MEQLFEQRLLLEIRGVGGLLKASEISGVPARNLALLVSGKCLPEPEVLKRVCDTLHVPRELLTDFVARALDLFSNPELETELLSDPASLEEQAIIDRAVAARSAAKLLPN
jgi:hypothetical protein